MEYKHFGAIGDILKHLMLCEFLKIEKPEYYCESNSAGAVYELNKEFNKQYGIIHFYNQASAIQKIKDSEYIKILTEFNQGTLSKYLGSPGLAMKVLGSTCKEYLFCDLDTTSLKNIDAFFNENKNDSKIILHNADGIDGVNSFVKSKTEAEKRSIFVHLDPYNPFENEFSKETAVELFPELANAGVKVMLWFGLETLSDRKQVIEVFQKMQKRTNAPLYMAETLLNLISESEAAINPGILGCGIIVCNLSNASIESLKNYGVIIEQAYKNSKIDNKYDGCLKFLFNQIL